MALIRLSCENIRFSSSKICQPCSRYNYLLQWRGLAEFSDNHYDVLGLKSTASPAQIKSAYYRLSKKYHPDVAVGVDNAKEKFAQLSTAYEVLSSPEKRVVYDRSLHPGIGFTRHATFTPDVEYSEFLRRRGTFRARAGSNHASPTANAWSEYEQSFRQRYHGRRMQQNWQARRNFKYRMRQNQDCNPFALWFPLMLIAMIIFNKTKNSP